MKKSPPLYGLKNTNISITALEQKISLKVFIYSEWPDKDS